MKPQHILVFQQNESGKNKIKGISAHGNNLFRVNVISLDRPLPPIIDDADICLPADIRADIVLDFLKHPDLSYDLAERCLRQNIPMVASGKKLRVRGVFTPRV